LQKPAILILSEDAGDYVPLLGGLSGRGIPISTAQTVTEARTNGSGQQVLLAQPDLAAEALPFMPEVRWIQSTWAGITPLLGFQRDGLQLTGVKDVFGSQISEYVLAYLLAREIRLLTRVELQKEKRWSNTPSGHLHDKTLCIMGTGSIGQHLASVARAFGMRTLGYSLSGRSVPGFEQVYTHESFHEFLAEADYLVAILPDTTETDSLLDATAFRKMKNSAYLVNVGRGNVLDEKALARALDNSELAGAALDVFQREPLPVDSPLWTTKNCLISAHVAAKSKAADIADIFLENYRRFEQGEALKFLVDMERGY